jgi:hypothetical protein
MSEEGRGDGGKGACWGGGWGWMTNLGWRSLDLLSMGGMVEMWGGGRRSKAETNRVGGDGGSGTVDQKNEPTRKKEIENYKNKK